MKRERQLYLRMLIEGNDLSPVDFIGLFECADIMSRHIAEQEAFNLFEFLNIPTDWRLKTFHRIRQLGRRVPSPAEVKSVKQGSWSIVIGIAGTAILFILKHYVHTTVKEAWDSSLLRDKIVTFIRERIFLGSKRQIEDQAIRKPLYRNLKVKSVGELEPISDEHYEIEISFEKQQILEVSFSERELIEEFIEKLKK